MKILIAGIVAFAVWCIFSAWMYNDHLLPVIKTSEKVESLPPVLIPSESERIADSIASIYAAMPRKLTIYFDFDKSTIIVDQATEKRIAEFRPWLDKYPNSVLSLTGHTDLVGEESYNNELAMKRARAVGDYIESLGIPSEKIIIESKGESEPAADNILSAGRAQNRRTELTIKLQ